MVWVREQFVEMRSRVPKVAKGWDTVMLQA